MRRVRFNLTVTVYELDDTYEGRRSVWITVAAHRRLFRRRICRTAVVLDPVLTEEHRLVMLLRTMRLPD